jgi:hypothetical protein
MLRVALVLLSLVIIEPRDTDYSGDGADFGEMSILA